MILHDQISVTNSGSFEEMSSGEDMCRIDTSTSGREDQILNLVYVSAITTVLVYTE